MNRGIPQVFHFPLPLKYIADGWVIRNLKEYGNSAVPAEAVAFFDSAREGGLEILLGEIMETPVQVRQTGENAYIAELVKVVNYGKRK